MIHTSKEHGIQAKIKDLGVLLFQSDSNISLVTFGTPLYQRGSNQPVICLESQTFDFARIEAQRHRCCRGD